MNWLAWIEDDALHPGDDVRLHTAGGGAVDYVGYSSGTGAFAPEIQGAAVLTVTNFSLGRYRRTFPDGSVELYEAVDTPVTSPRKVFLSKIIDPQGNTATLTYDSSTRLTAIVDATGRSTTFSYGIAAAPYLITKSTDPFGRSATFGYTLGADDVRRLTSITDVIGMSSHFTYDAAGFVMALTTPYGTTQFTFGEDGNTRFVEAIDPLGNTERLEQENVSTGLPASEAAAPAGMQVANSDLHARNTFYWDKQAFAVAGADKSAARIRHWLEDRDVPGQASGIIESEKQPLEARVWYQYPAQVEAGETGSYDQPIRVGRVLGDGNTQLTRFAYNSLGRPTRTVDPIGRETLLGYVSGIDLASVRQKASATAYDTIARSAYNTTHRPTSVTDAAGQITRYQYNAVGLMTKVTDPLGNATSFRYDSDFNLIEIINPNGRSAGKYGRDAIGRVTSQTDAGGHTIRFAYDPLDRLVSETYPDGSTRIYTWKFLDLVAVKDRQGRVTRFAHDAVRNLVAITDPLGNITRFTYYPNGTLKTLIDANGNVTTWEIDIQSRVTAKVYADSERETYSYEPASGRLKSVTDALGQVKSFTYSAADEVARITYTGERNPTADVVFGYDPFYPRVTSMRDGLGTTSYAYWPAGAAGALQPKRESQSFTGAAIDTAYDELGRVIRRAIGGNAETFAYDTLGRLRSHTSPLGAFVYSYLGETGQLLRRSTPGFATAWSYEPNTRDRRLKAIDNGGPATDLAFTTSREGNFLTIRETRGAATKTWTNSYDAANRLLSSAPSTGSAIPFLYDLAGNLTRIRSSNFAYNTLNQVTAFGYDANGNLLRDSQYDYAWDAEDRLVSVKHRGTPTIVATYRYDGMGRRVVISGPVSGQDRFVWCGDHRCQQRSATNAVTARYFAEGEIHAGNAAVYYALDQIGSIRGAIAKTDGALAGRADYDPYGRVLASSGIDQTDYGYAQLLRDSNTGLYLSLTRPYDAKSGRWLQRDPIEEEGGTNLYSYAAENPVHRSDRAGLLPGYVHAETPAGPLDGGLNVAGQRFFGSVGFGYSHVAIEITGERVAESVPGGTRIIPLKLFENEAARRGSRVDKYIPNAPLSEIHINRLTAVAEATQGLPYDYLALAGLNTSRGGICSQYVNRLASAAGIPAPIDLPELARINLSQLIFQHRVTLRPVLPSDISFSRTYTLAR